MLGDAVKVQNEAKIPCGYMSISLLNTSIMVGKPQLQTDFYNEDWVYGEPWARGRMTAEFLFTEWDGFCAAALDGDFYMRSKVPTAAIKAMFWGTVDKLTYLFACYAKYFVLRLVELPEFTALTKEPTMYVTCGTYLDWQERLYGVLPEIDLTDLSDNEATAFREFHGKTYNQAAFTQLDLRHCRFCDCTFEDSIFSEVDLGDAYFRNCRFRDTNFVQTRVAGSIWENCRIYDCLWQSTGTQSAAGDDEYFAEAEMVNTRVNNFRAINCDLSEFMLTDCRMTEISLIGCTTENSAWKNYEGGGEYGNDRVVQTF